MTRTLVTGAAGFTGRYVVSALADLGHDVHGVAQAPDAPVPGLAEMHQADIADLDAMRAIVNVVQPDHVIHLAAIAFVAHEDVEQMYRTNVVGTRQLLEALAGASRAPSSVLLASSANVYGNSREGQLDEDTPTAPANDYAISKLATEHLARIYAPRLPIIVTRPFNYTGVGQSASFLLPKIVAHVRDRAPVIELGNIDVARDFSDVRTLVDAYIRLLPESAAIGQTFNVCSGRAVTIREVMDLISALSGHAPEIQVNSSLVRKNEVRVLSGSPARLESVIGPLKHIPLEETLRWMLEG
jgi:nucleoside-diphosphate-sugar epimerase